MTWPAREPEVALIDMDRCEQVLALAPVCLSARETHRWRQYRHQRRQKEWLAGRLAAKALFWQRLEQTDAAGPADGVPQVQHLTPPVLAALLMENLRQIEILAPEPGKAPQLFWQESPVRGGLSVAHAGGWVCVAISLTGNVGIDVETCELRAPAYYRDSFSDSERQWVQRLGGNGQDRQIQGYTLLWAFKESLFKTGRLLRPGMIAADTIIVDLPSLSVEPPSAWPPASNTVTMQPVQLSSDALPRDLHVHAAYCFSGRCVITLIHLRQLT